MLFGYQKCINTLRFFLLVRILLKVVTEGHSILHVFDANYGQIFLISTPVIIPPVTLILTPVIIIPPVGRV